MADDPGWPTVPTDPVGRALAGIARVLALFGGIVLFAMALLTTVSVTGRAAWSAPIPGDFELIAIGTGIAVFAFLPYCQLARGNVLVDFFMTRAPARARAVSDAVGDLLYLVIAAILTWRLALGGVDMYRHAEKTLTLNFPRWVTFPVAVVLLAFLVIVIAYTFGRRLGDLRAGRAIDRRPPGERPP